MTVRLMRSLPLIPLRFFEDYACKYNKRRDDGIHYVGDASDTDIPDKRSDAVYIHVDFGDCSIEVLARVKRAIAMEEICFRALSSAAITNGCDSFVALEVASRLLAEE